MYISHIDGRAVNDGHPAHAKNLDRTSVPSQCAKKASGLLTQRGTDNRHPEGGRNGRDGDGSALPLWRTPADVPAVRGEARRRGGRPGSAAEERDEENQGLQLVLANLIPYGRSMTMVCCGKNSEARRPKAGRSSATLPVRNVFSACRLYSEDASRDRPVPQPAAPLCALPPASHRARRGATSLPLLSSGCAAASQSAAV